MVIDMPQVGKKKFPYTPAGIRKAKEAAKKEKKDKKSMLKGYGKSAKIISFFLMVALTQASRSPLIVFVSSRKRNLLIAA